MFNFLHCFVDKRALCDGHESKTNCATCVCQVVGMSLNDVCLKGQVVFERMIPECSNPWQPITLTN